MKTLQKKSTCCNHILGDVLVETCVLFLLLKRANTISLNSVRCGRAILAAALESARDYDMCRLPLSPVPGCRTTEMSSILEGRMPTRIRVVTDNRCTNLWCREHITGHQAMSVREYAIGVCLVMSRGGKPLSPRPRKSHALAGVGGWGNE